MKELDFDELDKAVNSLMANVKGVPQKSKEDPASTINVDVTTMPTKDAQPAPSELSNPAPRTSSNSTLPARRAGRFMDVMRPTTPAKKESPRPSISREAAMIAPSAEATSNAAMPDNNAASGANDTKTKDGTDAAPSTSTTIDVPSSAHSDWPDPIDLAPQPKVSEPTSTSQPDESAQVDVESLLTAATSRESTKGTPDQTPLSSPFLPDAKVEKRPLGGGSVPSDDTAPVLPSAPLGQDKLSVNNPDDQLPPAPQEHDQPLPEELHNDLVAIESGESTPPGSSEAVPITDSPTEKTQPKNNQPTPGSVAKVAPEPPKDQAPKKEPPIYTGAVSIPPQYREEPSSSTQQNGAIFDTDTYHKPLAHPGKKKSGWMWVVWILLIIALGAGIGAAMYFLGVF